MQRQIERRAEGVRRVTVERIVDVCATSAAPSAAFQGRSLDVSGRGMSVRAAHLPELNAPVVVRFQEHGSEVIAEGLVAWCRETEQGSEFGVRFTALDSRSVQALKTLCQTGSLPVVLTPRESDEGDTEPVPDAGSSVKLHIQGLGAPLAARVRQQGDRRLSLGSSLDFLRVGRSVEVEDGAPGKRRGARIDEVDVAIDPESHVPELIVSLCYEVNTPKPSAASARSPLASASSVRHSDLFQADAPRAAAQADAPRAVTPVAGAVSASPATLASVRMPMPDLDRAADDEAEDDAGDDDALAQADAEDELELGDSEESESERPPPLIRKVIRARVARDTDAERASPARAALAQSESDAQDESDESGPPSLEIEDVEELSDVEKLRRRLDGMLEGLSSAARVTSERCRRAGEAASRGASWMATHARGAGETWLAARRSPTPTRRTTAAPRPSLRSAIARAGSRTAGGRDDGSAAPRGLPRGSWLAAGFVALAAIGAWRGRPAHDATTTPRSLAPASAPASSAAPAAITPTPSTPETSPAPSQHSRPPLPALEGESEESSEPASALAAGPLSTASAPASRLEELGRPAQRAPLERRAMARFAPAEPAFEEVTAPRRKPSAPVEFASGRLELPIVHRLRLDQPGDSVRGEQTPTGFDVLIPGRKALESPTSIARRDARIAKVTASNGRDGARLSFRFRSSIPGYKVRLRKDYVEIFISSK